MTKEIFNMSRSYRHSPCFSYVNYFSNKKSKRLANQTLRTRVRAITRDIKRKYGRYDYCYNDGYLDNYTFPLIREVSNVYNFDSDGLCGWDNNYLRNDVIKDFEDWIITETTTELETMSENLKKYYQKRYDYYKKWWSYRWKMK